MIVSLWGAQPGRALRLARLFFFLGLGLWLQSSLALAQTSKPIPPEWLRLLHYQKSLTGDWSNDAGQKFFITQTGPHDPQAELEASIAELKRPGSDFHCKFPARAILLYRMDRTLPIRTGACPEWEGFRNRLNATGASLVFSSYYLNNPASAFGHSFLRIHRGRSAVDAQKSAELLDTGIGYAATVTTTNAFLYGFYGIFGFFRGEYTALPYYYKVREYADAENRDLWSYDLALSHSERELLVAHLWELSRAERSYYYFSKNCSYEILAILEAILDPERPAPQLLSRLPWFVIPSHTLQSLTQEPGLVRSIDYRPSLRKQLEARLRLLTPAEKKQARDWKSVNSSPELGARVLDARLDWIDFDHFEDLVREKPNIVEIKQSALGARAQTGVVMQEILLPTQVGPDPSQGHPPRRVQLALGKTNGGPSFAELAFRPALQDLLDPATGYPDSARLEFTEAALRFSDRMRLQRFSLFRAQSLTPISLVKLDPSWKVGVLHELPKGTRMEASGGLTLPVFGARVFGLAGGQVGGGTLSSIRPAASLELGLHHRLGDRFALLASWLNLYSTLGWSQEFELSTRLNLTRRLSLGAELRTASGTLTWQASSFLFF